MTADIIVSVEEKRYRLTIARLKELLMLNKAPITFVYEGWGSIVMTGLKKEYIKELDKIL